MGTPTVRPGTTVAVTESDVSVIPRESVTVTVTLEEPVEEGVQDKGSELEEEHPAGSPLHENEYGAAPPIAETENCIVCPSSMEAGDAVG